MMSAFFDNDVNMSLNRKSAPAAHWLIKQKHYVRQACAESKSWTC